MTLINLLRIVFPLKLPPFSVLQHQSDWALGFTLGSLTLLQYNAKFEFYFFRPFKNPRLFMHIDVCVTVVFLLILAWRK